MRHCPFCLAELPETALSCPRDRANTVATADEAGRRSLLGRTVGSWAITRAIARGGMGEVYEAQHPQINRRVAIKILSSESVDNPAYVQRFMTEAKAVNLIRHDNIIEVLDLACLADGRPYLVMEYLEGRSLAARLGGGAQLPLPEVGAIMLPVLDALAAAHAVGILHRDLKPDNVFLVERGDRIVPKVLDFGIAKMTDGSTTHTTTGQVLGTPQYMAPEQARALPLDARTDVYSAGVILFEMCCGRPPFSSPSYAEVLVMHIMTAAPSARSLRPDLPAGVEAVMDKALAKAPAQRWAGAREMGLALRDALVAAGVRGDRLAELPVRTGRSAAAQAQGELAAVASLSSLSAPYDATLGVPPVDATILDGRTPAETMSAAAAEVVPTIQRQRRARTRLLAAAGAAALVAGGTVALLFSIAGPGGSTDPGVPSGVERLRSSGARKTTAAAEPERPAPLTATVTTAVLGAATPVPESAGTAPASVTKSGPRKPGKPRKPAGAAKPTAGRTAPATGTGSGFTRTTLPVGPISPDDYDRTPKPK